MPERIDFWGIPQPWGPVLVYTVLALASLVMLYRLAAAARRWSRGRPGARLEAPSQRLKRALVQSVLQLRILSQRYAGWMHLLLSITFGIFFLGTVLATLNSHLFTFLREAPYLLYKLVLDLASLLFLIGASMALYRRLKLRPQQLTLSRRFLLPLWLLSWIVFNGLLVESLRLAVVQPAWAGWAPVGWLLSQAWIASGWSQAVLHSLHLGLYTLHVASVSLFLVTLPVSTLLHVISAPLQTFFAGRLSSGAKLEPLPANLRGKHAYAWDATGLARQQLLASDACTECGRCQDVCPAYAAGLPLSPKQVMLKVRAGAHAPGGMQRLAGGTISADELWACMACGACTQECPVLIDPLQAIVDFRRALVWEGRLDVRLREVMNGARLHGNTAGRARSQRAEWTRGLAFAIKDARREPVQYLWFVGDQAAFDPDLAPITRRTAEVFNAAGLDFGILYEAEGADGNDLRRVGEEGLYSRLANLNLHTLAQCRFQAVITTDPHVYNTLKNEYPPPALDGKPVLHYSQLLDQLIADGKLPVKKRLSGRVTYHDPCYLGRINGVYDAPRRVLAALGCTVVEMKNTRAHSLCCGAGGGRMWMDEGEIKQRPCERRIEEALALDGVETLVVACPKDWIMFADAGKDRLAVKDLAELVADAIE